MDEITGNKGVCFATGTPVYTVKKPVMKPISVTLIKISTPKGAYFYYATLVILVTDVFGRFRKI